MELTHRHSSFTTALLCLNDDKNKMFNHFLNMEHDLVIYYNVIDNPMSLSNTLFLEEEQLSKHVHKDFNDLNLYPSQ